MSRIVLVTGATAGIGEATAELFAQEGWDVIITGRRAERLQLLQKKIESKYGNRCLSLCFDVRDQAAVNQQISTLDVNWRDIDVLVNNAGLASGRAPIQDADPNDWELMLDTNVKGLLYVTHAVTPGMIARKGGHIINISSIAGKQVYANGNVYCASKHAVDALCKGMRIDLLPHGIKVTSINPGAVDTEFSIVRFKGDKESAANVYKGYTPLYAEDIADTIYYAASRPKHVTINELIVMPTAQASAHYIVKE